MLRSMNDLEKYAIGASDGPIGQVKDFYFDDDAWAIRYLVVETGSWFTRRQVLISPISIKQADWSTHLLQVSISKEQVRDSPDIDTDKPVSRQQESDYYGYYGYPVYWGGTNMWGEGLYPYGMLPGYWGSGVERTPRQREDEETYAREQEARHRNDNPHLRSCQAILGYHIHASDGDIGHVAGLLVDEETWAIRFMVIDTTEWWSGHQVLIAPPWISAVRWADRSVSVNLSREAIRQAPPYDSSEELNRQQESSLYAHYARDDHRATLDRLAPQP